MDRLHLDFDRRSYDIFIGDTLEAVLNSGAFHGKVLLITDSNVARLYADIVSEHLMKNGAERVYPFVFAAGEQQKNIKTLEQIWDACISNGLDRHSTIIALGGGVVGDMAGFAASTFMRGIRFVQIPTTLLAQTDSSVGGKVGIDYGGVKNIVGSFLQPASVHIATQTLQTLPDREFGAGMAEVVKYGVICDGAFFGFLKDNLIKIQEHDSEVLAQVIYQCCRLKARVVMEDERETGMRAILNFGHTIGHGIESAMDFELLHGECVGLGMLAALQIACSRGMADAALCDDVHDLLIAFGLPVTVCCEREKILFYMHNDKKKENGSLRFVLPDGLGRAKIVRDVSAGEIDAAIDKITL